METTVLSHPFTKVSFYGIFRSYILKKIFLQVLKNQIYIFLGEEPLFNQGDMAVYPAHGVGVIKDIETQVIGGKDQSFYILKILDNDMTIMIPTSNSDNVGLRAIICADEVDSVLEILQDRNIKISSQTWNRRYRDYMEKIKTGSVFEVAAVLRDLYLLKDDKELSYGERKMMDNAKKLLVKEISLAQQKKEEEVEQHLERIFS